MNFLKRLFKTKNSTKSKPSEVNILAKVEQNTADSIHEPVDNPITIVEGSDLSLEEKRLLIEQLATGEKSITDLESIDTLIIESARLIVMHQQASTSLIQRRLKLGYNRAGRIMDFLELAGVVGPFLGEAAREVKIKSEEALERLINAGFNKVDLKAFYNDNRAEIEQRRLEFQEYLKQEKFRGEKEIIKQELLEIERKKQLKREVYKELLNEGKIAGQNGGKQERREPIPQDVMDKVWNRDGGKCVICGSQEKLEFDHIIPFSRGGADSYRNLQILCKNCNLAKSNNIG